MRIFYALIGLIFSSHVFAQTFAPLPTSPAAITKTGRMGLRYSFVSNTLLQPAIDNEPNHRVKVENIGPNAKTNVRVSYTGLNADSSVPTLSGGGFAAFPNGGSVNLASRDTTIVQGWSSGWRECSCISDGNNNKFVRFIFSYDSTYYGPDGLPDGTIALADTVIQPMVIVQRSASQQTQIGIIQTSATQSLRGQFIIPGYIKTAVSLNTLSIATNGLTWSIFPNTPSAVTTIDSIGNRYYRFSISVDPRSDYRIEAKFNVTNTSLLVPTTTIVVPNAASNDALSALVLPYGKAAFSIDSVVTHETEIGFWRTAFAQGDSSITVFPGQENWFGATNTDRNANRAKSKIIKYKADWAGFGTKLWEFATPTECWGGAVSKDGKHIVYMINQRGLESGLENNPAIDWVGVLDATTGQKKWGLRGNQQTQEGLEVGISATGQYIALGTTGTGRLTLYRNNGSSGTVLWSNPADFTNGNTDIGQVRKLVFSDDEQFVYAGCGDMYLRKYRVSNGTLVWKAYIGGWPFVNGLTIANGYVVTGTKSRDRTVIRDTDGAVQYFAGSFGYDVSVDSSFTGPIFGFGAIVTNRTSGRAIASIAGNSVKHSILNGSFVLSADRTVDVYSRYGGTSLANRATYMGAATGEQSQSGWASATGDRIVVAARDLTSGVFPRKTVAFYKINRSINRYPTMDSIGAKTFTKFDTLRLKISYRDFNDYNTANTQLSITATPETADLKTIVRGDSIIVYGAAAFNGLAAITVSIAETSTAEKWTVSERISVTVNCNSIATPTITKDINNFLVSSSLYNNTWYKDNVLMTDTSQKIKPTSSGNYTVKVIQGGCSSTISSATNYIPTALVNLSAGQFIKTFPNPVHSELKVQYLLNGINTVKALLYDVSGKMVLQQNILSNGGSLPMGNLIKGSYLLRLYDKNGKLLHTEILIKD
jgi:hypothetical protein